MSLIKSIHTIINPIYLFQRKQTLSNNSNKKGLSLSIKKQSKSPGNAHNFTTKSPQKLQTLPQNIKYTKSNNSLKTSSTNITRISQQKQLKSKCRLKNIIKLQKQKQNNKNMNKNITTYRSIKIIVKPKQYCTIKTQQLNQSVKTYRIQHQIQQQGDNYSIFDLNVEKYMQYATN